MSGKAMSTYPKNKNSAEQRSPSEELKKAKEISLQHADDLLEASQLLIDKNKFNLGHHMAVLALEEVGKFELYRHSLLPTKEGKGSPLEKWGDNHERKLFWALWTPALHELSPEHFTETQRLSQEIHELRLDGLYTRVAKASIRPPKVISLDMARAALSFANARVGQLRNLEFLEMSSEEHDRTAWFLAASEDESKRPYIFNSESMQKLKELGQVSKWVEWVQQKIASAEAEAVEILKNELDRAKEGFVSGKTRWRIRIRLHTNTHSIRPKVLSWWNENIDAIKLTAVGKLKDQLDMHVHLSDRANAQNLYQVGEMFFTHMILAMNLGSMGFFWRSLPQDEDRYFDQIEDLEHPRMNVGISNPKLLLSENADQNRKKVLDQSDLERIANCLGYIARIKTTADFEPFAAYRSGLNLLSKSNVHGDFRLAAFQEFNRAFKKAAILFKAIVNEGEFVEFFENYIKQKEFGDGLPVDRYLDLVKALDGSAEKPVTFSTDDLWTYKVFLEGFMVGNMKRITNKEIVSARKKSPNADEVTVGGAE